MTDAVHVVAVGARTPLGLRAAPAAAAVRAGISALRRHPFLVDRAGDLMPAALDSSLDPRALSSGRLSELLESAIREACALLGGTVGTLPRALPLCVGLPELRPGFGERDVAAVRAGLGRIDDLPVAFSNVDMFVRGHAAGILALARAVEIIRHEMAPMCLVAGVDSYFQPDTLEWLDANRQIVGSISRSAFVPGEGAGCCLLMSERASDRYGIKPLLRVVEVGVGYEAKLIKTSDMCLGEGLTATVGQAVQGLHLPDQRINQIICDINGERYRGEEWGFVCLRLGRCFDNPAAYLSPADCWGDMGAASGPLFVMLACEARTRGYAKGPRTLAWAGSESGCRAAALLADAAS